MHRLNNPILGPGFPTSEVCLEFFISSLVVSFVTLVGALMVGCSETWVTMGQTLGRSTNTFFGNRTVTEGKFENY